MNITSGELWRERILDMLGDNPGRKEKFLRSVLGMIESNSAYFPTESQKTILRPMWNAYERRQAEAIAEAIGHPAFSD